MDVLDVLYVGPVLFSFVSGLVKIKALKTPYFLLWILLLYLLFEYPFSRYLAFKYHNNLIMSHINTVLMMVIYSGYYYYELKIFQIKKWKWIFVISVLLVLVSQLFHSLFIVSLWSFASFSIMLECFYMVFLAMITFVYMLNKPMQLSLYKQPLFWVNMGSFIYHAINFFYFTFFSSILPILIENIENQQNQQFNYFETLLTISNFLMYSFIGISFLLHKPKISQKNVANVS